MYKRDHVRLADLDYALPKGRIALRPLQRRDGARLLVLGNKARHRVFRDLPKLLPDRCVLVLNDTRVLPARIFGLRDPGGGRVEILCVRPAPEPRDDDGRWLCLGQAARPLRPGTEILFSGARATVLGRSDDGLLCVRFDGLPVGALLAREGHVPLPPYIKRPDEPADRERYQTVYAAQPGAVAAPTAGLHFSPRLLARLAARCEMRHLTLHVGPGTFLPPSVDARGGWRVPPEPYAIPRETLDSVAAARREGRAVVAVGTTTTRALETWARTGRAEGETGLVLAPGDDFRVVTGLITNFHLPRTTLLALACAFGGEKRVLAAYRQAIREGYRFYSYGDAMLLWPPSPPAPRMRPARRRPKPGIEAPKGRRRVVAT